MTRTFKSLSLLTISITTLSLLVTVVSCQGLNSNDNNNNNNYGGSGSSAEEVNSHHLPHQHSLTVVMQAGDAERCFFVTSHVQEDRMFFEYKVRNGRPLFDLAIKQPGGHLVYQHTAGEYEESEGNKIFFISKATGEYSLCINNVQEEKVITINAAVASKKRATRTRDPVIKAVAVMKASIEALLDDQVQLRSRERAHRDTLEAHNTQVIIRFFIEVVVLLGMSVGQVVFLRKLFEKKQSRAA